MPPKSWPVVFDDGADSGRLVGVAMVSSVQPDGPWCNLLAHSHRQSSYYRFSNGAVSRGADPDLGFSQPCCGNDWSAITGKVKRLGATPIRMFEKEHARTLTARRHGRYILQQYRRHSALSDLIIVAASIRFSVCQALFFCTR